MTALAKIEKDFTNNIIRYSTLGIILSTCVASMAVITTMMQENGVLQMISLFLVVSACSAHNAAILTVQKPSIIFKLLKISLIISVMVMTLGSALNTI